MRADVTDPRSVRGLLGRGDVLVTTVGPFLRLGQAAVDAAVDAGAVYLDSTGEPPFVRRRLRARTAVRAAATGAALIPAFGLDYVPGNLAAALALAEAGGRAHRVDVGYSLDGASGPGASPAARWSRSWACCSSRASPSPAAGWSPRPRAGTSGASRRAAGPGAGCRSAARST